MAATVTSKISLLLNSLLANTLGIAAGSALVDRSAAYSLASGVGANQADKVYTTTISRTHGAPAADLDLAGSLTDAFGATITMARIKALIVLAATTNINSVIVGGGATAAIDSIFEDYVGTVGAQPALKVMPGGMLVLVAPDAVGYAITATTHDKIQFASGDEDASTSVSADVVIIGASA